jgi:hypothetical protein
MPGYQTDKNMNRKKGTTKGQNPKGQTGGRKKGGTGEGIKARKGY